MEIIHIENFESLPINKYEWNNILKKSNNNNIFLTWEWLSTWFKYFGTNKKCLLF